MKNVSNLPPLAPNTVALVVAPVLKVVNDEIVPPVNG